MNNDILLSTKFKSIGEDATVSMPSQIKALFGMNPQIDVRLIDYDYIGDAKDDDYTSFAEKLYKANPNAHYILVTSFQEYGKRTNIHCKHISCCVRKPFI